MSKEKEEKNRKERFEDAVRSICKEDKDFSDIAEEIDRPCDERGYCPFGRLAYAFPSSWKSQRYGYDCKIRGSGCDCPAFFLGTETEQLGDQVHVAYRTAKVKAR